MDALETQERMIWDPEICRLLTSRIENTIGVWKSVLPCCHGHEQKWGRDMEKKCDSLAFFCLFIKKKFMIS